MFTLNERNYLITVDYYSNYWEIDRLDDTTARPIINKTKAHFGRHGIPDIYVSDNGPQYSSEEFQNFSNTWEFEHGTSAPGNSKANGMAESAVKTAKNLLRKAMKSKSDAYLSILDYLNTPSQNTCNRPAQKLLGRRRTKALLPYKKDLLEPNSLPTENITNKLRQSQDKQAYYYNKNAKDLPELRSGDTVGMNPFRLNQREWDKAKRDWIPDQMKSKQILALLIEETGSIFAKPVRSLQVLSITLYQVLTKLRNLRPSKRLLLNKLIRCQLPRVEVILLIIPLEMCYFICLTFLFPWFPCFLSFFLIKRFNFTRNVIF